MLMGGGNVMFNRGTWGFTGTSTTPKDSDLLVHPVTRGPSRGFSPCRSLARLSSEPLVTEKEEEVTYGPMGGGPKYVGEAGKHLANGRLEEKGRASKTREVLTNHKGEGKDQTSLVDAPDQESISYPNERPESAPLLPGVVGKNWP